MSNDKTTPKATDALKDAKVTAATTGTTPEVKPEPKPATPSVEDVTFNVMVANVTATANELVPKREKGINVVDLEATKYEQLFKAVASKGQGFKRFGKVTNYPTGATIIKDDVMYRKMQKLTIEVHGGEVRYHGNMVRWFNGKGLNAQQLSEMLKARPEPKKEEPKKDEGKK